MKRRPDRSAGRRALEQLRAPRGTAADSTIDTVGLYCPVPIIKTAERMKSLDAGQVLEIVSDDRVILIDMPAWCVSHGHTYLGYEESGAEWRLYVRKN